MNRLEADRSPPKDGSLSHSAARHKMAVRPRRNHAGRRPRRMQEVAEEPVEDEYRGRTLSDKPEMNTPRGVSEKPEVHSPRGTKPSPLRVDRPYLSPEKIQDMKNKSKSLDLSLRDNAPSSAMLSLMADEEEGKKTKSKTETEAGFLSRLFGSKRTKTKGNPTNKDEGDKSPRTKPHAAEFLHADLSPKLEPEQRDNLAVYNQDISPQHKLSPARAKPLVKPRAPPPPPSYSPPPPERIQQQENLPAPSKPVSKSQSFRGTDSMLEEEEYPSLPVHVPNKDIILKKNKSMSSVLENDSSRIKFHSSVENWSYANEGLKRSIYSLADNALQTSHSNESLKTITSLLEEPDVLVQTRVSAHPSPAHTPDKSSPQPFPPPKEPQVYKTFNISPAAPVEGSDESIVTESDSWNNEPKVNNYYDVIFDRSPTQSANWNHLATSEFTQNFEKRHDIIETYKSNESGLGLCNNQQELSTFEMSSQLDNDDMDTIQDGLNIVPPLNLNLHKDSIPQDLAVSLTDDGFDSTLHQEPLPTKPFREQLIAEFEEDSEKGRLQEDASNPSSNFLHLAPETGTQESKIWRSDECYYQEEPCESDGEVISSTTHSESVDKPKLSPRSILVSDPVAGISPDRDLEIAEALSGVGSERCEVSKVCENTIEPDLRESDPNPEQKQSVHTEDPLIWTKGRNEAKKLFDEPLSAQLCEHDTSTNTMIIDASVSKNIPKPLPSRNDNIETAAVHDLETQKENKIFFETKTQKDDKIASEANHVGTTPLMNMTDDQYDADTNREYNHDSAIPNNDLVMDGLDRRTDSPSLDNILDKDPPQTSGTPDSGINVETIDNYNCDETFVMVEDGPEPNNAHLETVKKPELGSHGGTPPDQQTDIVSKDPVSVPASDADIPRIVATVELVSPRILGPKKPQVSPKPVPAPRHFFLKPSGLEEPGKENELENVFAKRSKSIRNLRESREEDGEAFETIQPFAKRSKSARNLGEIPKQKVEVEEKESSEVVINVKERAKSFSGSQNLNLAPKPFRPNSQEVRTSKPLNIPPKPKVAVKPIPAPRQFRSISNSQLDNRKPRPQEKPASKSSTDLMTAPLIEPAAKTLSAPGTTVAKTQPEQLAAEKPQPQKPEENTTVQDSLDEIHVKKILTAFQSVSGLEPEVETEGKCPEKPARRSREKGAEVTLAEPTTNVMSIISRLNAMSM